MKSWTATSVDQNDSNDYECVPRALEASPVKINRIARCLMEFFLSNWDPTTGYWYCKDGLSSYFLLACPAFLWKDVPARCEKGSGEGGGCGNNEVRVTRRQKTYLHLCWPRLHFFQTRNLWECNIWTERGWGSRWAADEGGNSNIRGNVSCDCPRPHLCSRWLFLWLLWQQLVIAWHDHTPHPSQDIYFWPPSATIGDRVCGVRQQRI